jgi:hypothetical protein
VISAYPGSDDEMICIANFPVQDRPAGVAEEQASVVGTSEAVVLPAREKSGLSRELGRATNCGLFDKQ